MTISAKVITDSLNYQWDGQVSSRLTTLQLRYPRFIHAEFMTHRALSKNSSSSRAIPVERLIQDIIDDTAMPIHWGKNQPGMQANEEHTDLVQYFDVEKVDGEWSEFNISSTREAAWCKARDNAIEMARAFAKAGYHKQIVNRILEPFVHMNVLVSGTEWSNFFALRRHKDAQPEIQQLANEIWQAMELSKPKTLKLGEWHLPYITREDQRFYDLSEQIQMSVARCARVSYLTVEGAKPTVEQDIKLYERLVGAVPLHASPAEHVAQPDKYNLSGMTNGYGWQTPEGHGNFIGWVQFRKMLPGNTQ